MTRAPVVSLSRSSFSKLCTFAGYSSWKVNGSEQTCHRRRKKRHWCRGTRRLDCCTPVPPRAGIHERLSPFLAPHLAAVAVIGRQAGPGGAIAGRNLPADHLEKRPRRRLELHASRDRGRATRTSACAPGVNCGGGGRTPRQRKKQQCTDRSEFQIDCDVSRLDTCTKDVHADPVKRGIRLMSRRGRLPSGSAAVPEMVVSRARMCLGQSVN
jgi:hypothetical protein